MDSTLDAALALFAKGYVPIRIEPDSKGPRHLGWQTETPTEDSIRRAFSRTSNLGARCGDAHPDGTRLLGIDIDIDNAEVIRCVERAIGEKVPCKQGKKGYTYLIRVDREQKTTKIPLVRDKKKTAAIDILCQGAQTVLPPSIHPDTKLPYRWVSGQPLWEVDYRSLPVFGLSVIDEIRGFLKNPEDPIYKLNDMEWRGVGGGGNTHDTCVTAVSSMVARHWTDEDIQARIMRAKREAAETSGMAFNWPEGQRVIQEWINSSRDKKFDTTSRVRVEDVPLEIINRYVYVASVNRMFDTQKGTMVNIDVFNNIHARDIPKPWMTVMVHPDLRIVDKLTYNPGEPIFCKEKSFDSEAVLDCLNVYSPPGVEPEEGDVGPFVQLVKDVMDNDPVAYGHVFQFFAYAVQNPGERINHALVIQGEQGIGKDSIIHAMEKVFGIHNCSSVTLQHVESAFNEWLFGKQLIVFQEMLATGRRNIYNKLKTYITDPVHTVNTKHISLQRVPNKAVYVFLTNYKHALSLDPGDRRMWVWYSKMVPKPPAYYKAFYAWLSDRRSVSALYHWLLNYDTGSFNPSAAPPMTDAKRALVEASASEIEQYLRNAADSGTWPMACDLVSVQHLHGALRGFMRVSLSMIQEALDNLFGEGLVNQRPKYGSAKLRLRSIRNFDKWKDATGPDLRDAYRIPLPPQMGETEGSYAAYTGDSGSDSRGDSSEARY